MHLVSETRPPVKRDRFLRLPEVEVITGLKKSTLYKLMKEGAFVRGIKITPRCVAFSEAAVLQWVQYRISASTTEGSQA